MKKYLIKAYFKAGILVPFYTACIFSLFFSFSSSFYDVLELTFLSGLTALCSLTIFLNCYRKVVDNYLYSALSWSLLPLIFIFFVLSTRVDWIVFKDTKKGNVAVSSLYLVIFFLHLIGIYSSFQSFRATVVLNKNDEEVMNIEEDIDPLLRSAKNEESMAPSAPQAAIEANR